MLKIYGDADVTVSDDNERVAPVIVGSGLIGAFWTWYLISVEDTFSDTTNWPEYPSAVISSMRKGVSTSRPAAIVDVVTVIILVAVTPSPALILEIPTDSPVDPTIRNSSIFGWISRPTEG